MGLLTNLAAKFGSWGKRTSKGIVLAVVSALLLLVIGPAQAFSQPATTTRPISDFVSTQGTYCLANPAACPNFAGSYVAWTSPSPGRIAVVDFAAKEPVVGQLGTTTSGTVTERPLVDGRVQVRVRLGTQNALTFVQAWDGTPNFNAGAFLFGRTAAGVQAGGAPGVGDSSLEVTFVNSGPGAALPDLVRYVVGDLPIEDLRMIAFQARASGPLRAAFGVADGTPGRAQVTQAGLIATAFRQGFKGGLADGFPVEHINLSIVGR